MTSLNTWPLNTRPNLIFSFYEVWALGRCSWNRDGRKMSLGMSDDRFRFAQIQSPFLCVSKTWVLCCCSPFGKAAEHRISLVRSTWRGCLGKIAQAAQTCSCGVPISRSTSAKMQSMTWGSCQGVAVQNLSVGHCTRLADVTRALGPGPGPLPPSFLPSGIKSHNQLTLNVSHCSVRGEIK